MEKVISRREDSSALGFGADVKSKKELATTAWAKQVISQDLVRYGLIPELVGRLPVITSLDGLDENALVSILTEPKNSLMQQYRKLFQLYQGGYLCFTDDALHAIARKTLERHTGARGLRSIMEGLLQDLMFNVPSEYEIEKVTITGDTVEKGEAPLLERNADRKPVKIRVGVQNKRGA